VVQSDGMSVGSFPAVLVHEGAGIIRRLGTHVTHLQSGDLVLLRFFSCMSCHACQQQQQGACQHISSINFGGARGVDGTPVSLPNGRRVGGQFLGEPSFSELAIVDVRSVVKYIGPENDLSFLRISCREATRVWKKWRSL